MDPHAELRVGAVFSNAARAVPDRVAAAHDGETLTFGELDAAANRLCRALAAAGVGRGDRVAVWAAPSLSVVGIFAALAKLGAVFVPLNPQAAPDELGSFLTTARPALLVADRDRAASAPGAAGAVGCATETLEELVDRAAGQDPSEPQLPGPCGDDPHVIFFTSGSTGRPKGTVLSHRVNVLRTHPGSQLEPRGAAVCPYPFFHMSVWTLSLQQWQARDMIVYVRSDPAEICRAIDEHRATRINAIPAVWQRILDFLASPRGAGADLSSMRFCDTGTSATPLALLEAIRAAVPSARVRVFYGSTEAGCVTGLDQEDFAAKPGSCGLPAIWAETRIAPDGELWVRGPLVFDGYFEDPEATAASLTDGWCRTGDLAAVDGDGYLSIVGRASSLIRSGGESVAPAEVEGVLRDHPAVADVAVVGVPDDRWGEVVCAAVVSADTAAPPSLDDLRRHCDGRLARFKHPRAVVVLEAIPRTPATLQVQRKLVVELAVSALGGGGG